MNVKVMDPGKTGQVTGSAAEIYDRFFLPALFAQWAAPVCEAAGISDGGNVLDVGCGTGVLALEALHRVGCAGTVTGIDCNDGMLAVAGRKSDAVRWQRGEAEVLPFDDHAFDVVVSQFALMFFEDRRAALAQMWRVLKPGGRLAVAVWDRLENTPGYAAMVALLERLFGARVANALHAPYALGDVALLRDLFAEAGIGEMRIDLHSGTARFPSIDAWVHTDIKGWTLADAIDDEQFGRLRSEAKAAFGRFVLDDGSVAFDHPAIVVTASKGEGAPEGLGQAA